MSKELMELAKLRLVESGWPEAILDGSPDPQYFFQDFVSNGEDEEPIYEISLIADVRIVGIMQMLPKASSEEEREKLSMRIVRKMAEQNSEDPLILFFDGERVSWDPLPHESILEGKELNRVWRNTIPSWDELQMLALGEEYWYSRVPFYVLGDESNPWVDGKEYPFFVLEKGSTNYYENSKDYGYETTFHLRYSPNKYSSDALGKVKILEKGKKTTELPRRFFRLPNRFYSLGQAILFYEWMLSDVDEPFYRVLKSLNDVVWSPELAEEVREEEGFNKSLLRDSEANRAFQFGRQVLLGQELENRFSFTFSSQLEGAIQPHQVDFTLTNQENRPSRIFLLVGRNGTGKTQYLARLAHAMSGQTLDPADQFFPKRPGIGRVLAISYSIFDKFEKPKPNELFSYRYCGILGETEGIVVDFGIGKTYQLGEDELTNKLKVAVARIQKLNRVSIWRKTISEIINSDHLALAEEQLFSLPQRVDLFSKSGNNLLSSGQSVLLFVMTELVAYLLPGSLVTYDEPEMHLHPNAISKLMIALHDLLEEYDSYAVLATHSPLLAQEVPAEYIRVFDREGDVPLIRRPRIETFGEDLTTLTDELFETHEVRGAYKKVLDKLAQSLSFEEVQELFEGDLPLNVRIYLKSLYAQTE